MVHGIVVVVVVIDYLVDWDTSTVVVDEDKDPTPNMLKSIDSLR